MRFNKLKTILIILWIPVIMGSAPEGNYPVTPVQFGDNLWMEPTPKSRGPATQPSRKSNRGNFGMPPDILKVRYEYYDIKGHDRNTLYRQMHKWSMNKIGQSASGYTEWKIFWSYEYRSNRHHMCTRFNFKVSGEINFSMPRLTNYHKAPMKFRKKWDSFYRALQIHEDGHAHHGVQALKEIMRLKPRLDPPQTCQAVAEDFNARARKIISKFNQKDIEYDRRTRHGRTQGISL